MLYGFDETDVRRLRRLLQAFEQGRLRDAPPTVQETPRRDARDTYLGQVADDIAPGATGTFYICSVDNSTTPPTVTPAAQLSTTYTLFNTSSATIPASSRLPVTREPSSGLWLPARGDATAYVQVTSTTPQAIQLGRSVADGVTASGSPTLTSSTAAFASDDVGRTVTGSGITTGTTIASVQSSTSCTMSANATATASGVSVVVQTGTMKCYQAHVEQWSVEGGQWQADSATVYLFSINGETPLDNTLYPSWQIETDAFGLQVFACAVGYYSWTFVITEEPYAFGPYKGKASPNFNVEIDAYMGVVSNTLIGPPNPMSFIPTPGFPYRVEPSGSINLGGTLYPYFTLNMHAPVTEYVSDAGTVVGINTDSGRKLTLNANNVCFGPLSDNAERVPQFPANTDAFTNLFLQYGGQYKGATGTDAVGNIFVSGLNINVGGTPGGDTIGKTIDGGSVW